MKKHIKKLYDNNKQSIFIITLSIFIIITSAIIRFSSEEDSWACSNGQWIKHGKPKTDMPTSTCLIANNINNNPVTTVENFYNWYFQTNKKDTTLTAVKKLKYFTSSFSRFIATKTFIGKNNPFTCRQGESVISFNVYEVYQKDNKAIISVYQNYIDYQDKVDITLKQKAGLWQFDSIKCNPLLEATEKLTQSYN